MTSISRSASFLESLPRPTAKYHTTSYERISQRHGFDGSGKTALITGGSSGIGLRIARAFAAAGTKRVALFSRTATAQRSAKEEIEAVNPSTEVVLIEGGIEDAQGFASALRHLGDVDVLILCAGAHHGLTRATDLPEEDVRRVFEANAVSALVLAAKYLAAEMPSVPTPRRTVIHLASAVAQMRMPLRSAYGASKAAAVQAMRHLAMEALDPMETRTETQTAAQTRTQAARVFSFHPGVIRTPGVETLYPAGVAIQWEDPDLPAHFALWLAGPESNFLSGRFVWANWDVDELIALRERMAREEKFLTIGLIL